jgi:hypothetical protein
VKTADHGYGRYTAGCHCTVCTGAKRQRTRDLRAPWRARLYAFRAEHPGEVYVVEGITHGHSGYVNFFCRCPLCSEAKRKVDADARQRRKNETFLRLP